ncbi:hypothetical protein COCNU_14G008450 [Cocos nucifera]|uniref:Uncharacterized protein n=1 Tax=Cocos nucifera TaxID=13894 RepID=A0A8K0IVD0_COCNU|nr:hypothetical protein COCNU_14G008450 [Cocos nucifera]
MSSSSLLESGGGERRREGWWRRILDAEEAKGQLLFALPMILTNMSYYAVTLVSVMFAGHLGDLELAGATLGNSWGTVTGIALMGLWTGLICGLFCQASTLLVITLRTKWTRLDLAAKDKQNYVLV